VRDGAEHRRRDPGLDHEGARMLETPPNPTRSPVSGESCPMPAGSHKCERAATAEVAATCGRAATARGLLAGGCCPQDPGVEVSHVAVGPAARRARAVAGVMFLIVAGGLAPRRLPGGIALWPASLVPTWFGISHLVAGVTGYAGCPELGAIPSVILGRPVGTTCELWRRIDGWVGSSAPPPSRCP
jgi:hypothetical protein